MAGRTLRAATAQPVTFVELFFDLVFVFAVTQVTHLAAYHLDAPGVLRSLLLFWLIWWAWTQFTWTLNPADTTQPIVQVLTLGATAVAFVMAASVPGAFDEGALWFAVPYVVVRLLGLGLQARVDLERPDVDRSGIALWITASGFGMIAVLAGAVADPAVRPWVWLAAAALDVGAAAIAGRRASWDLNPAHISERHGLFVIIALGESLIVVGSGVAEKERTVDLVAVAALALTVTCLLWWTYFGWLKEALEHALARFEPARIGQATRDAFSLAHFPLVGGIIGLAVAIYEFVGHPGEVPDAVVVVALGAGIALFTGCAALAWWRLSGRVLWPRLAILALLVPALVVAASGPPTWPLAVVAIALAAIVVVEGRGPGSGRDAPHVESGAHRT